MARSAVIYVVILKEDGLPVAGFTVKHELQTWAGLRDVARYKFFRVKDGLGHEPKVTEIFYPFDMM